MCPRTRKYRLRHLWNVRACFRRYPSLVVPCSKKQNQQDFMLDVCTINYNRRNVNFQLFTPRVYFYVLFNIECGECIHTVYQQQNVTLLMGE